MTDTNTSTLRLQQPTVGADNSTWGTILNTDLQLVDDAVNGIPSINIGGLTTYTLTANVGATDQARCMTYSFTGTLTANCTVTLPSNIKVGYAVNNTTGGYSVILTTGSGTTATVTAAGAWTLFYCDGTNVVIPIVHFSTVGTDGAVTSRGGFFGTGTGGSNLNFSSQSGLYLNQTASTSQVALYANVQNASTLFAGFLLNGIQIGSISNNGSATFYNTTSDESLKTNVRPAPSAGAMIDALPIDQFDWIADGSHVQWGGVAQKLHKVFPDAVTIGDIWSVDWSKYVPALIKELQDVRARLAELEAAR